MGTQLPQKEEGHSPHPIFGPCLLWLNGWMDQDATWYGDDVALDGETGSQLPVKGPQSPIFGSYLHRVSKNAPPSTCYDLDIHDPTTIMFGRSVTKKERNQTMLCFLTSPI